MELVLLLEEVLQQVAVPACNKVEQVLEDIDIPEFVDSCNMALSAVHIDLLEVMLVQHQGQLLMDCVHQFLQHCSSVVEVVVVLLACKGLENLEFASFYHFLSINNLFYSYSTVLIILNKINC